jgi:hypothetical protein
LGKVEVRDTVTRSVRGRCDCGSGEGKPDTRD